MIRCKYTFDILRPQCLSCNGQCRDCPDYVAAEIDTSTGAITVIAPDKEKGKDQ